MHVVITGASSGIGAALARELAGAGHALTLVARRQALLDELAAELGDGVRTIACDLADVDRALAWLPGAEAAHGPVDVLVNNAGVENTGPSAAADPGECRRLLDLNLVTPLLLARAVMPGMIGRGRGTIVNVASLAALVSVPMQAYYGASKAGLAMFSETLRGELAGTGVHVVTVYPGPVTTAMAESAVAKFGGRERVPALPEGDPAVLATRIHTAIRRRQARVIYPRVYTASRWLGPLARALVDRFAPKQPLG
ncbi:MAG: SDR family NAD(P)-dependent oxidoreductase [Kofleriaceae bacterium]